MGVAAGVAAAGVVAAGATAYSSSQASSAQTSAANNAMNFDKYMYTTTRNDLEPYNDAGQRSLNAITSLSGTGSGGNPLTSYFGPVTMDQATLEQTPGYQFNLAQGLKATQNSAAARGLGVSGAAMKGAATYATGLADSTYQNQFNNAVTNQTNVYNRLQGIATLGENAAAQTGAAGTQTAANVGNALIGAGNAQAGAATATGNAIGSAANSYGNAYLVNSLLKGNGSNGLYTSGANPSVSEGG